MIEPLNWREITYEAMRRRKSEGMTQEDVASLAGVSRATVIALERGETSVRLDKALEILRVLGLAIGSESADDQDSFVRAARERWEELVAPLPLTAPARFPHGFAAFDYEVLDIEARRPRDFLNLLQQAVVHQTGWPPFWIPKKEALRPTIQDGLIECWLGKPNVDRVFDDAAHSDFWRASPSGRLYLQRGYQEDGPDVLEPGTIFDLTLPIWRCGEILLHAESLAHALAPNESKPVKLRAHYTGLAGRDLVSWAKPSRRYADLDVQRSRTNEVTTTVTAESKSIVPDLANLVRRWLTPLYERFDFFDLSSALVEQEISQLMARKDHFRPNRSRD